MADKEEGRYALTAPGTLTFPNLLEARAVLKNGKPTGDPKYSVNLELAADHPDLKALKAKAAAVAKAKWPGRDLAELAFPFADGNKLADKAKAKGKDREFSRGKAVLTARSKYQPKLSIIEGGKLIDLEGDAIALHGRKFYSGCEVLAQVTFSAYDEVGNGQPGVNAYIDIVVSLNRGTKVMGGASAAEVFKSYVGLTSDEDPTTGIDVDEEIPF